MSEKIWFGWKFLDPAVPLSFTGLTTAESIYAENSMGAIPSSIIIPLEDRLFIRECFVEGLELNHFAIYPIPGLHNMWAVCGEYGGVISALP